MAPLTLRAPAKINLFLELLGKRADGYHELVTVMQALTLADEVVLERGRPGVLLETDDPTVPTGPENLAVQAARLFHEATGTTPGERIILRKRIPAGGGLGGGSSDAAAVLVGLNRLFDTGLDLASLEQLAGRLGSDVPFFVRGGCARCTGRGEQIHPLPASPRDMAVLVVMPDLHVPTPAVYRAVVPADLSGQRHTPEALEQALTQQRTAALGENVFNRLESIAARVQPALCELGVFLRKTLPTARAVQLSGSGACWFALYMSQQDARREAEELRRQAHLPVRPVVTRPAEARPQ